MSRKRRTSKALLSSGPYVPVVLLSAVFGLAAGAVGMLMAFAYGGVTPMAPSTTVSPSPVVGEPRMVVDLPPVPERDLSRSVVRFFAPEDVAKAKTSGALPPSLAVGAGVVLTSDGWVIAYGDAATFKGLVARSSAGTYEVERVIVDPYTGAAFVKLNGTDLPVTPFNRGPSLLPGTVLFGPDVTEGIARLEIRSVGTPPEARFDDGIRSSERIQSAIRVSSVPGMLPGAPLTDGDGEVVAVMAGDGEFGGLAIPVDAILGTVSSVLRDGVVDRPVLGVSYIDLSRALGGDAAGARVTAVASGSPARGAGLRQGDVIVAVNGERVSGRNPLPELVAQYGSGDSVTLEYERNGAAGTVELVLGAAE